MNASPGVGRLEGVSRAVPETSGEALPGTRIVLASASPRRSGLLAGLGLELDVRPADIDESVRPGEDLETYVDRLAFAKASAVSDRLSLGSNDPTLVIAADTVVVIDGVMLGKPEHPADNRAFLDRLSGRSHRVSTGHCLIRGGTVERMVRTTDVTFRDLTEGERDRYVATGEGADKAGGYAIQGVGASLVDCIDGCYFTVVGLSLATVVTLARRLGVALV